MKVYLSQKNHIEITGQFKATHHTQTLPETGFIKTIHNIPGTVIGSFILIEGYKEIFIQ